MIFRGRIIDAVGEEPIEKGLVAVEGERIVYAGEESGYPIPRGAEVVEIGAGTVMPGFIDCHAHLCGLESIHRK